MENKKLIASILKLPDPQTILPHPDLQQQEFLQQSGYPYVSYLDKDLKKQGGHHIQTINVKKGGSQGSYQRIRRNPRVGSLFQITSLPSPIKSDFDSDHCIPVFVPPSADYDFDKYLQAARKFLIQGKYVKIEHLIVKKLREKLLKLLYEYRFNQTLVFQYLEENLRLFMDAVMAESMIYNRKTAETILTQFPK